MLTAIDIQRFVAEATGIAPHNIASDTDLFADLGIDGDDFHELMAEFEKRYTVDMSSYCWYFHHGEEGGPSLGGWLFPPPQRSVTRMAITPALLLASAKSKQWLLSYPAHRRPTVRKDILFNKVFFAGLAVLAVMIAVMIAVLARISGP